MKHSIEQLLPGPYRELTAEQREVQLSRLSADISYADKEFIRRIFPAKGLFNRLVQIFFNSLVQELKQNGITTYTPENADALARAVARRCAITPTAGEVANRHVP